MKRRDFIAGIGSAAAWPVVARGQQVNIRRIGALMVTAENDPEAQSRIETIRQGFRELGWIEGGNLRIDYKWTGGDTARTRGFAAELVRSMPDVIIANGTLALLAIQRETKTIPVVFVTVGDPVGQGFAASLSHPGGNITGFTSFPIRNERKVVGVIKGDRSTGRARFDLVW